MPRTVMKLTMVAALTMMGSGVLAYSTEPTYTVTDAAVTEDFDVLAQEVCVPGIPPELAHAFALPEHQTDEDIARTACANG